MMPYIVANTIATKATATHPKAPVRSCDEAPFCRRPTFHSTKGAFSQRTVPRTVGIWLGSLLSLIACSVKYLMSMFPNLKIDRS